MEKFKKIEEELNTIIIKQSQDLAKYQKYVKYLKDKINQLTFELTEREKETDVEGYNKVKTELSFSQNSLELYSKKINKLTQEPMITKEQHRQYYKKISDQFIDEQDKLSSKLENLLSEIKKLSDESLEVYKKSNDLLYLLNRKVCRIDFVKVKHPFNYNNGSIDLTHEKLPKYYTCYNFYNDGIKKHTPY
ncbi:hypothetical protein SAMN04488558_1128 [Ignavigranum ruoffiae]|uniref:Uncharacterized protein n=1 Tax=Ignavigranum ruoffiae TaxID=89093 RepID=A0A1H9G8G5_9LACT|nr:hypothetical protein [Ignavigranum ruoffiae]SEQ46445.1 hypothetical protein SAMN04488558_1128 [Ignavigranum ruoffiae]